jgi:multidrug efflux pump subunit AcrA (membrane-fusion protein)
MNERSKSFTVEAEFVSRPATLYPNLTVEANIVLQAKPRALTIPRVYLVNDSTVIFKDGNPRRVLIGLKDYQRVEIISGLDTSDLILRPQP